MNNVGSRDRLGASNALFHELVVLYVCDGKPEIPVRGWNVVAFRFTIVHFGPVLAEETELEKGAKPCLLSYCRIPY